MLFLETPVSQLRMVGERYATLLSKLEIQTVFDLLFHIPFRYENYATVSDISKVQEGEVVTIIGTIKSFKNIFTKTGAKIQKAVIVDKSGEIEATWYNQLYLSHLLKPGTSVSFAGHIKSFSHKLYLEVPEYEIVRPDKPLIHTARLVPIYPETMGLSSKWLRSRIFPLLELVSQIPDPLPPDFCRSYSLLSLREALEHVHFPKTQEEASIAKKRICFDELLTLQLIALLRKRKWQEEMKGVPFDSIKIKKKLDTFIKNLPFELTNSQINSIKEIESDLLKTIPMNRLLEGDVGSGKTVVALAAALMAVWNGYQVAFMAPTEILATQHFNTIQKIIDTEKVEIALVTGKTKKIPKNSDIFIGTHALLSKSQRFKKLGLIIIDEQHRFGVIQRALLTKKGSNPHILSLTATPIPRTIALTIYKDLDLSILDQVPQGRLPIKTYVIGPEKLEKAYDWIKQKIIASLYEQQAFIVCPLIEESDSLESVKAAKTEFAKLSTTYFSDLKVGLLHGRMKPNEKERILSQFQKKEFNVLVTTPVVEVGIDVASATIMLIDGAERFGLAQLHQLRGRVGRSNLQSYCIVANNSSSERSISRLKLLESQTRGHILAEFDLKMRGQGDIFGTKQHGVFGLKYAAMEDVALIQKASDAANTLISQSRDLTSFPLLIKRVQKYTIEDVVNN